MKYCRVEDWGKEAYGNGDQCPRKSGITFIVDLLDSNLLVNLEDKKLSTRYFFCPIPFLFFFFIICIITVDHKINRDSLLGDKS